MGVSVYAWSTWKLPLALSIDFESFDYHVHTFPAVMELQWEPMLATFNTRAWCKVQTVDLWTRWLIPEMKCGSVSQCRFSFNICTLLLVGSRHFLASSMEVYGNCWGEVSLKAAGVHSSSKITKSFAASFPGLPTSLLSVYTHGTFETNRASLGHLSKSGRRLSWSS